MHVGVYGGRDAGHGQGRGGMKCKCGATFEASDSIGSDHGLCQDCWEALCAERWWDAVEVRHRCAGYTRRYGR